MKDSSSDWRSFRGARHEPGVLTRMMEGPAVGDAEPKAVMIDATYVEAHRTASSLRVKEGIATA